MPCLASMFPYGCASFRFDYWGTAFPSDEVAVRLDRYAGSAHRSPLLSGKGLRSVLRMG